jgi:hypothetical protein
MNAVVAVPAVGEVGRLAAYREQEDLAGLLLSMLIKTFL